MASANNDDDKPLELPISKKPQHLIVRPQRETCDPRFNPLCAGSSGYIKNYTFIDEMRQQELAELQRSARKEKDPEKLAQIRVTISRLRNSLTNNKQRLKRLELKGSTRGKSELKKRIMVDKFQELKESGKLNKYLERKRKKLIKRDAQSMGRQ